MGIWDFLSNQLVDVVDWVEQPGELAIRYPLAGRELKNGAQLTVREGQIAFLHQEGQVADAFGPGLHVLETANLPILTALMNWDKGFVSPFKSDIYFYTTKEQPGMTWGTSQPIAVRDPDLGPTTIRAFGRYSFHIEDVAAFATRYMGTLERLTVADVEPQLRAVIATALATSLGQGHSALSDLAGDQAALSLRLQAAVQPAFAAWGLECSSFFVESLSLPDGARDRPRSAGDALVAPTPRPGTAPERHPAETTDGDPYAMIARLHELLSMGALTQAEFDRKKTELLARIG